MKQSVKNAVEERKKIDRDAASKILRELDFFFNDNKDKLKQEKNKKSSNLIDLLFETRWEFIFGCLTIIALLSFAILFRLDITGFAINSAGIIFIVLLTGFTAYSLWKFGKIAFQLAKQTRPRAVLNAEAYNFNPYYELINELGENFYAEHLQREELRFKLILEDRRKESNIIQKGSLLISILLIVLAIWIYGPPKEDTEISLLFDTIVGFSGISFVVKVALDILLEWRDQQDMDVYNKCIFILQNAQIIAKEEESDALRAYDEAILANDETIPFEQAIAEIEQNR